MKKMSGKSKINSDHARTSPEASLILAHALNPSRKAVLARAGAHSLLGARGGAGGSYHESALMAILIC